MLVPTFHVVDVEQDMVLYATGTVYFCRQTKRMYMQENGAFSLLFAIEAPPQFLMDTGAVDVGDPMMTEP